MKLSRVGFINHVPVGKGRHMKNELYTGLQGRIDGADVQLWLEEEENRVRITTGSKEGLSLAVRYVPIQCILFYDLD